MKRAITIAALIALFNPISAAALQTERDIQGITRVEERIARARAEARWDRWVQEVQMRLQAATASRMEARYAEPTEATAEIGVPLGNLPKIIYAVFGAYGAKAVDVASCESGLNTSATNGQYFGLFQMGEMERAIYGGSSLDPWDQTRAAFNYFVDTGYDWSPWSMGKCA